MRPAHGQLHTPRVNLALQAAGGHSRLRARAQLGTWAWPRICVGFVQ